MIASAFDVLWVHKPDLLSKIDPFSAGQLVGIFDIDVELGRVAGLHVVVYDRLAVGSDLQVRLDAVAPGNQRH